MKIVVIGGTGLIGSRLVAKLREQGQDALPASPSLGINTITGEGLPEALQDASVVVDVSNSPSLDPALALEFFRTSSDNLRSAERAAGVRHHVVLSIIGKSKSPTQKKVSTSRLPSRSSIDCWHSSAVSS